MCAGVEPQQAPITVDAEPAHLARVRRHHRRACRRRRSGRRSTCGRPALRLGDQEPPATLLRHRGIAVAESRSGPRPQFAPTAVAPKPAIAGDGLRGRDAHHRAAVRVEAHRRPRPELGGVRPRRLDGGLDLGQVAHGLDQDEVERRRPRARDLLREERLGLLGRQRAERREELARRADVAGDEDRRGVATRARSPPRLVQLVTRSSSPCIASRGGCRRTCWS